MIEPPLIHTIEELSMNAWPALHTLHDDGWVMCFANGYGRRANAVYAHCAGNKALQEKIAACESIYRSQRQRIVFKLTKASFPSDLDAVLAANGYEAQAHTSVQYLELDPWSGAPSESVSLSEAISDEWLAAYACLSKINATDAATHRQILNGILLERCFATISIQSRIIACGLGVLQNGWAGFYDIRVNAAFRRQGHAQRLMTTMLAWAKAQGATRAYLQVMLDNPPALALYKKIGFQEAYRYWYRVKA